MSLTYSTLQAAVLAYSHRAELTAEAPGFIRLAEGMIRRDLRAVEVRDTLEEADRSSGGVYTLPSTLLELRAVYATASNGTTYALENIGLPGIRMLPSGADVQHYAVSGSTIEFRGVPATDASIEIVYLGWPAELALDADTNSLLQEHEAIYLYGALHHLYLFTQDLELARGALELFNEAVEKLNRQTGRRIGGASVLPGYNFGHISTSQGY